MTSFTAFILANTRHGAMILNRFDQMDVGPGEAIGVGGEMLAHGEYQAAECDALAAIMALRRDAYGPGVVVLDVGANIGAHTCRWARACEGWGEVYAYEAQERVYYALAGNLALGNHFNAHARHAAVGMVCGVMAIPQMRHTEHANFGGLHLMPTGRTPGQSISYEQDLADVEMLALDALNFARVDLIKIDVEGMEVGVLKGAARTIQECCPVIYAEHAIAGLEDIQSALPGYVFLEPAGGANVLCVHAHDPVLRVMRG